MKRFFFISILAILTYTTAAAQIISKFTWETNPVTTAVIGPNANSVSLQATSSTGGSAGTRGLNAGIPSTDIELTFSSPSSLILFDGLKGIDLSVDFKRKENTFSFFSRGSSTDFGVDEGSLYVKFLIKNESGGSEAINSGSILTIPNDNLFHNYRFTYDNVMGKTTVEKDNVIVYTHLSIAGRSMYWTGAGNVVIGKLMDGTGSNVAILDNLTIAAPGAVLPLTLLSFTGYLKNGEAFLNWVTNHEVNTDYFDVERTSGSSPFIEYERLNADGNHLSTHEYSSTDRTPFRPDGYYRLKMVDRDAHFSYSPIIHISYLQNEKASVYPNPATNFVWLRLANEKPENYQLSIYGIDGTSLASRSFNLEAGSHELEIRLPPGTHKHFLMTLIDDNGSKQSFKIVKQ